jgi:hypothetical protein
MRGSATVCISTVWATVAGHDKIDRRWQRVVHVGELHGEKAGAAERYWRHGVIGAVREPAQLLFQLGPPLPGDVLNLEQVAAPVLVGKVDYRDIVAEPGFDLRAVRRDGRRQRVHRDQPAHDVLTTGVVVGRGSPVVLGDRELWAITAVGVAWVCTVRIAAGQEGLETLDHNAWKGERVHWCGSVVVSPSSSG